MAERDLHIQNISEQVYGKYQHCTMWRGRWYADSDLGLFGRPKLGSIPRPEPEAAAKYEWPFCEPDTDDCYCCGMSVNGTQYRKKEISPGIWQWVVDDEAMQHMRDQERERQTLWWDLRTRVLNNDEMERVRRYGSYLNTPSGGSYNCHEKALELNAALAKQAELRILAGVV